MQQDLSDAVAWAIKEGFADASRVAIMGGSYGGYATLAGLAFTPELYCCGVDIVGPAHLRTLLQSIPPRHTAGATPPCHRRGLARHANHEQIHHRF